MIAKKKAPANKPAAKKPVARVVAKAPGKTKRRVVEVEEDEDEVEAEESSSQCVLLNYVAQITGKKIIPSDVGYTVDGELILKAQVVAVVGKTIFYRTSVNLGEMGEVQLIKGMTCIDTEEGKLVVFDPSAITIVTLNAGAGAEEEAEDEDEVPDEDEDEDEAPAPKKKKGKKVVEEEDDDEVPEDDDEVPDDDEDDEVEVPKKKKGKKVVEEDDDEGDDDFSF